MQLQCASVVTSIGEAVAYELDYFLANKEKKSTLCHGQQLSSLKREERICRREGGK